MQVAWWADMRHFLSVVCLDLTELGENNSHLGNYRTENGGISVCTITDHTLIKLCQQMSKALLL